MRKPHPEHHQRRSDPASRRRLRNRYQWVFEWLEERMLLATVSGSDLARAVPLSAPTGSTSGSIGQNAPIFFQLNSTSDAQLVAHVSAPGLLTRLSLLDSQGNLLIQSDGESAIDPDDMIDLNVGAETDYLELQSLAGSGTYTLTTELTDSSQPDAPVAVGGTVGSVPPVVTGPLGTTSAVVGTIQNTPLAADPGDGTEDVFTVNQGGDILWRKGDSQAPGSFSAPVTINPGDPSRAIAFVPTQSNDLLASVDLQDNAVSLYAYNGGQFVRVDSLATGALPTQIVAGDLTGNGNTDLVVLDARDGAAAVYLGDGLGGFARGNDVPVGLGASDIALADVDGTGRLDLLVTNQVTGLVTVFSGTGNATFNAPSSYPAGAGSYSLNVAAGDAASVTSDEATAGVAIGTFAQGAAPSLATIDPGTNSFAVLSGLGAGAIANPVPFLTTTPATVVRAGDFTGNGLSDLALLGPDGVTIDLSDGASRFSTSTTYFAGPDPTGLSIADVNGDHNADLLVGDPEGDVLVLMGNGDGTFQSGHIPIPSTPPVSQPAASPGSTQLGPGSNNFPVNSGTVPEFPVQLVALNDGGVQMVLTEELDQADHAAQLFALNETSLALVGSLLVTTLNTTASATLAAGTENQAVVNTSSLLVAPSQGQSVLTTSTSPESKAVPTGPETPVAQGASAPLWARSVLGVDEHFQQFLQDDPAPRPGPQEPVAIGAPTSKPSDPVPGSSLTAGMPHPDRFTAQALDEAIDSLAAIPPSSWRAIEPPAPDAASPAPQVDPRFPDRRGTPGEGQVSTWVSVAIACPLLIHASPLIEALRDRRRAEA